MNQIQIYEELIEWAIDRKEGEVVIDGRKYIKFSDLISYLKGRIEEIKKDEATT